MGLKNWMASLRQSTPLYNVSIPGTHESCALHDDAIGMTQCQELTIPELLNNGIRFLDIRPGNKSGWPEFEINHGGYDQFITFAEVQKQVVDFLKANPSEVVLMNIQQEYYYLPNADFVKKFDQIIAGYRDYWYFEERIPTIEEARGRIVLVRGYNPAGYDPVNPTNGSWVADKGIPLNALTLDGLSENDYFRTQNYSQSLEAYKKGYITDMIEKGVIDRRIVLNYLSYAHGGTATPRRDAAAMNPYIYQYIKQRTPSILGVLPMDFATNTPGFIEEIISNNLRWGEVVAGNFSGKGGKEMAVFVDKGNNTTGLSLFLPTSNGYFELKEVWDSGPRHWQADRTSGVVAGDFTGAGSSQIAAFFDYGSGQTKLWLFSPTGAGTFQHQMVWDSGIGGLSAQGIYKVVVGDFTGSGKDEIAVLYDYHYGRTCLWLFSASSPQSFQPQMVWDSGFGNWNAKRTFQFLVGDFSGTGRKEIAAFYDYYGAQSGLWLFSASSPQTFQHRRVWKNMEGTTWGPTMYSAVVVGDFTGSGRDEIAALYDYNPSKTGLWLFSAGNTPPFQPNIVWAGKLF